jgi:hypothetical protein
MVRTEKHNFSTGKTKGDSDDEIDWMIREEERNKSNLVNESENFDFFHLEMLCACEDFIFADVCVIHISMTQTRVTICVCITVVRNATGMSIPEGWAI